MEFEDTLSHICLRLDDSTLFTLYLSSLRDKIRLVLQSPHFWYQKCTFLLSCSRSTTLASKTLQQRAGADWRQIYYSLLELEQEKVRTSLRSSSGRSHRDVDNNYIPGLGHLDSFLVLVELYGEPKWTGDEVRIWSNIRSSEVFSYLTSKYLQLCDQGVHLTLLGACRRGNVSLVEFLVGLVRELKINSPAALCTAIVLGHTPIVKFLISEGWTVSTEDLDSAIDGRRTDILEYLLSVHEVSPSWVAQAIVASASQSNEECCTILVSRKWDLLTKEDREDILLLVIEHEFYSLLPQYSITLERGTVLHRAFSLLSEESCAKPEEILSVLSELTLEEDRRLALTFSTGEHGTNFPLVLGQLGLTGVDVNQLAYSIAESDSAVDYMQALLGYPTFRTEDLDEEGWKCLVGVMVDSGHSSDVSRLDVLDDEGECTISQVVYGSCSLSQLFRKMLCQPDRIDEILALCTALEDEELLVALKCTSGASHCNPELVPLRDFLSFLLSWDEEVCNVEVDQSSIRLGWKMFSSRYVLVEGDRC